MLNVLAEFRRAKWAISPDYLLTINGVLERWASGDNAAGIAVARELNLENQQRRAASGSGSSNQKSVGYVPVIGPVIKRQAQLYDSSNGTTGMESAGNLILSLDANPNISSILLEIDSPGGTVDGTESLANIIKNCSKPVIAFVNGRACSAAYWIASQCDTIVMNEQSSEVGSIGVLCSHIDASGWYANEGLNITYITSDRAKDKIQAPSNAPLSEEALASIKAELNPIHDQFISAVKSGRRGKMKTGNEDVFTGKTYTRDQAIQLGLADKAGNMDTAMKEASKMGRQASQTPLKQVITNMKFPTLASILGRGAQASEEPEQIAITASELSALEAEAAAAKAKNKLLKTEVTDLTAQVSDLTAKLATAETSNETHLATIQTLQNDNARMTAGGVKQESKGDTEDTEEKKKTAFDLAADEFKASISPTEKLIYAKK